jgi:8-oxo-dGTP diphosphatase
VDQVIRTRYVLGFLFSYDLQRVALIHKERPNWQKGKLNGIGGHLEEGEMSVDAMSREFFEETGVKIPLWDWQEFCQMEGSGFRVDCFTARLKTVGDDPKLDKKTDEMPCWYSLEYLHKENPPMISHLKWLIPMALEEDDINVFVKYYELKRDS